MRHRHALHKISAAHRKRAKAKLTRHARRASLGVRLRHNVRTATNRTRLRSVARLRNHVRLRHTTRMIHTAKRLTH